MSVAARTVTLGGRAGPLPRLGFGCEQLGGHAWGASDRAELEAAVVRAAELGVRLFDTADCYGLGESESRLGRLLAPFRADALIATKFGVRFDAAGKVYYDASPAWARTAIDGSLRRLGIDCIDLYQLHYPDGVTPLEEVLDCLARLRDAGKCRQIGVTNVPLAQLPASVSRQLASVSYEYSLVAAEHAPEIAAATARGLTTITYGTLGPGLLSGRYGPAHAFPADDRRSRPAYRQFHGDRALINANIVAELRAVADAAGATPAQVAVSYVLHRQPGAVPLVGAKRPAQIEDAVAALAVDLSGESLSRLEAAATPLGDL